MEKTSLKTASIYLDTENSPHIHGNFEFNISKHVILNEDLDGINKPCKQISLFWCVDLPNNIEEDKAFEILSDKLKIDFIKYMKHMSKIK